MKLPFYQVDAFADELFKGNPAGVCICDEPLDEKTMQRIATENNLSETAFITKRGDEYDIRWFTPTVEVDLCGHATLASAHVLFNQLHSEEDSIVFHSKSGYLQVSTFHSIISMDFPSIPLPKVEPDDFLSKALGTTPKELYKGENYLAVYDLQRDVEAMHPNFSQLKALDAQGVIVTAPSSVKGVDFVSRYFAPSVGINEDPVTGSAHSSLAPYWSARLEKTSLHALQVSKRGGEIFCEHRGDRVVISGKAITYLTGTIEL